MTRITCTCQIAVCKETQSGLTRSRLWWCKDQSQGTKLRCLSRIKYTKSKIQDGRTYDKGKKTKSGSSFFRGRLFFTFTGHHMTFGRVGHMFVGI